MPSDERASTEPRGTAPEPVRSDRPGAAAAAALPASVSDDPEYDELVRLFVTSAAGLRDELSERLARGDVAGLRVQAHQLKGAAGGYGFPLLTAAAAGLEAACEARDDEAIVRELARVLDCLAEMIG